MAPPIIEEFHASAAARRHMLEKHGIEYEEALDAVASTNRYERTYTEDLEERRYLVPGKTEAGDRIWVVFSDEGGRRGRIITARPVGGSRDQSRHRRMRGD